MGTALSHWPARIPGMKWTNGVRRYIPVQYLMAGTLQVMVI